MFSKLLHATAAVTLRIDTATLLLVGVAVLTMSVDALSRNLRRRLRLEGLPVRLSPDHAANPTRTSGGLRGAAHAQQPVA